MNDFSVLIPAAGCATRLGSYRPKCLTKFSDGDHLWEKQFEIINDVLGKPPIYFVAGFEYDKVERKIKDECNLIQNTQFEDTNVAWSLYLGLQQIKTSNVLIIYGDLFFNENLIEQIQGSGDSFIMIDRKNLDNDEVGLTTIGEKAVSFDFGLEQRWSQIAYFQQKEKNLFTKEAKKHPKHLGFEILNRVIDKGGSFNILETEEDCKLVDIDSFKDVLRVNEFLGY